MLKAMSSSQRTTLVLCAIAGFLAVAGLMAWPHLPQSDPESYFRFADDRFILGIPNYYDVTSNIFFIYVSVLSVFVGWNLRGGLERRIFEVFVLLNVAVFLTGWGSSYFHLNPQSETLFWDRLPMALGFGCLVTLILVDRVVFYYHRVLLLVLNVLTFWSVWNISYGQQDLRPYVLVQFGSLLLAALVLVFFSRGHIRRVYFFVGVFFYGLAKAAEIYDHDLFALLGEAVSGHTLKHILSAGAIASLNLGVLTSQKRTSR